MIKGFKKTSDLIEGYRVRNYIKIPDECSHLTVYLFLKKHCGKPTQTTYHFDGNKYRNPRYEKYGAPRDQWFYHIKSPHGYIEIYDRERSWLMITIYLPNDNRIEDKKLEVLIEDDLKIFMNELKRYCDSMINKEIKANEGIIVLNSYDIHYSNFKYHVRIIKKQIRKYKSHKYFHDETKLYQMRMLTVSAFILLVSSFEGFVNLLYECFLNENIRNDNTMLTIVQNLKLETKMKMLSVYCNIFSRSFEDVVPSQTELFRRFKEIMRLINNLSHGNFSSFAYTNMAEADGLLFYIDHKSDLLFTMYVRSGEELINFLNATDKTV